MSNIFQGLFWGESADPGYPDFYVKISGKGYRLDFINDILFPVSDEDLIAASEVDDEKVRELINLEVAAITAAGAGEFYFLVNEMILEVGTRILSGNEITGSTYSVDSASELTDNDGITMTTKELALKYRPVRLL